MKLFTFRKWLMAFTVVVGAGLIITFLAWVILPEKVFVIICFFILMVSAIIGSWFALQLDNFIKFD